MIGAPKVGVTVVLEFAETWNGGVRVGLSRSFVIKKGFVVLIP